MMPFSLPPRRLLSALLLLALAGPAFTQGSTTLTADATGWQGSGSYVGGPWTICAQVHLTKDAPYPNGVLVETSTDDVVLPASPVQTAYPAGFGAAWSAPLEPGTYYASMSATWFMGEGCWSSFPVQLELVTAGPFTVDPTVTGGSPGGAEPRGHGYWLNHPEAWPMDSLVMGPETLAKASLLDLLALPPRGDATYMLAKQLAAAKLNVAAGCPDAPQAAIQLADLVLDEVPLGSRPVGADKESVLAVKDQLEAWNSGSQ